ncbi:hypothetical protein [Arsenicicoccus sp. oral taxon 190]|uniref:hypothetical protein n=1 Tax=Arsenicicoccus sp. oral taxon 190 TaxID=1658671 RepID=UPI000AB2138D|nr:hypothetical protein [Arsenicicoccus sp. oral taxon 190]
MTLQTGTHTFTGRIAGLGFSDGTRVVVGRWAESPFGAFTDVMVERPGGHRVLLAPTDEIAETVAQLYTFDEVVVTDVEERTDGHTLHLTAGPLTLQLTLGDRTTLGRALHAVPAALASKAWWSRVTDPIAQALLRGVRTQGTTANGLPATYGATDLHAIRSARASWDGQDLGALGPVSPPVRFGFGSTPTEPAVTSLTTTIEVPEPDPLTGVIDCWGMGALREKQARDTAAQRDGAAQQASVAQRDGAAQRDAGETGPAGEAARRHVDDQEAREVREEADRARTSQVSREEQAEGAGAAGEIPTPLSDAKRVGELPSENA